MTVPQNAHEPQHDKITGRKEVAKKLKKKLFIGYVKYKNIILIKIVKKKLKFSKKNQQIDVALKVQHKIFYWFYIKMLQIVLVIL